ncbi:fatty acid desaturase [Aminobacter anthyllidis]|uniref:fatty acid desaturase n=1 Tax=Aminobacter anthyllidis TaxID=1035067 RepID=UPI00245488C0|nr:fatty acid desaturase [Aminobacter anthyllidis]MDH4988975.1 fatty acid desaturase [Aminobacter anthyllidis]
MAKNRNRRGTTTGVEWPTVFLILGCYGTWLAAGMLLWQAYPVAALAVMALMVALQSSLVHEVLHGHPTRNARINEALVSLPIGVVWPYRRFKTIHLRHHADERLTDPFDDPESYYRALWQHDDLSASMKLLLSINNTMAGRFVLGPLLACVGFFIDDAKQIVAGDKAIRKAWLLHAAGLAVVLPVVQFGFGVPLWLYVLVPVWLGQSLISIRTFAEHQWSEHPEGRTVIVERSPLSLLFLNNNLHFVHHKSPTVAWYKLPALFRARRAEWLKMNKGYVYPNYFALVRAYAFRAKEPVCHPALRRAPEQGRAFVPRVRARSVNGLGTAPVPAEPPKE